MDPFITKPYTAAPTRARLNHMTVPDDYDLIARHIVAVKDLGAADRLFGGVMLAWLDEAGAAYAKTQAGVSNLVTRHIEAMDFLAPGREGDVLAIYGHVSRMGKTSISVEMKVLAEDPASRSTREIVTTTFVFVAVDKWGKKTSLPQRDHP
jgi:acyl-CoA thioesterase YciA